VGMCRSRRCGFSLMSHYRRLKIEGGAFFFTLALADRGGDAIELSGRFGGSDAIADQNL